VEENPSQPVSRPQSFAERRERSGTEVDKASSLKLPDIRGETAQEVYGISPQSGLKPIEQKS
jgi:hypothetical protein